MTVTEAAKRRRPARRVPLDPAKLTHYRVRAGLSMSELARRTGRAPSMIDGLERGYHGASPYTAKLLAIELGVRIEDLLYSEDPGPEEGPGNGEDSGPG